MSLPTSSSREEWAQSLDLLFTSGDVVAWEFLIPPQHTSPDQKADNPLYTGVFHCSAEIVKWLGLPPNDPLRFTHEQWLAFCHPEDREGITTARRHCLENQLETVEVRYRLHRPDGEWRWVLSRGRIAATDENGRVSRLVGIMLDIDRQHAEAQLERVEAALRQAIRAAHLCLWFLIMDDTVPGWEQQSWLTRIQRCHLFIRGSHSRQTDVTRQPQRGASWLQRVHSDDLPAVWDSLERVLIGGESFFDVEYRSYFNPHTLEYESDWVWVHVHGEVTNRNAAGLPTEISGAASNVSRRKEAEAALDTSRRHTALAVQSANLGLWSMDFADTPQISARERISTAQMTMDDTLLARLGYEDDDLPPLDAQVWLNLVHPDDLPVVRSAISSLLLGSHPFFEWQYRVQRKDGSWRWLHDRGGVTRFSPQGVPLQISGAFFDITKRRAMEEEAKTARRKLAAIFLGAELGSWELVLPRNLAVDDPELIDVAEILNQSHFTVSDGFASRMGYSRSDIARLSGPELLQLCHPEDARTFLHVLSAHILGSPDVLEMTFRMRRKDQDWCWVTTRGGVVERNISGRPQVLAGTIIDATRNKQAEFERDAAQEKLSLAARAAHLGVWSWDLQADTWHCDDGMNLGYDRILWQRGLVPWRTLIHPEDLPRNDQAIARCRSGKTSDYDQILRLQHHDGSWRYLRLIGRLTEHDENGQPKMIFGIHMDVSELMQAKADADRQKIRLEQVIDTIDGGIWDWDVAADTMFFSANFLVMLGYAADAFPQSPLVWKNLAYAHDWEKLEQRFNETLYTPSQGNRHEITFRARAKDGGVHWILVRYAVVSRDNDGVAQRVVGLSTDVTAIRTMRKELEVQAERMQLAITAARDAVWDWDIPTNRLSFDSQCSSILLQGPDVQREQTQWETLVHPDDLNRVLAEYYRYCHCATNGNNCDITFRIRHAQEHWILNRAVIVERDDNGRALRLVGVCTDITDLHRTQDTLREQLNCDPLTALHSRNYFERELERLQHGQDDPVSVIACDLDGLKMVNDTLGHIAGDQMLIKAAELIKTVPRTTDVVARTGGDEMVVILPRCPEDVAKRLLAEIRTLFDDYNAVPGHMPIGISLGLATTNLSDVPVERLLVQADQRMYADKLSRRESSHARLRQWLLNTPHPEEPPEDS